MQELFGWVSARSRKRLRRVSSRDAEIGDIYGSSVPRLSAQRCIPRISEIVIRQLKALTLALTSALLSLPLVAPGAAVAQKRIPKLEGYDQCPLGYVNNLATHCVSPIYYKVKPTYGKPCDSGWMNIGAGYCKKKTMGIF